MELAFELFVSVAAAFSAFSPLAFASLAPWEPACFELAVFFSGGSRSNQFSAEHAWMFSPSMHLVRIRVSFRVRVRVRV